MKQVSIFSLEEAGNEKLLLPKKKGLDTAPSLLFSLRTHIHICQSIAHITALLPFRVCKNCKKFNTRPDLKT